MSKIQKCCANCALFQNGDTDGHGWCFHNDVPEISESVCAFWEYPDADVLLDTKLRNGGEESEDRE